MDDVIDHLREQCSYEYRYLTRYVIIIRGPSTEYLVRTRVLVRCRLIMSLSLPRDPTTLARSRIKGSSVFQSERFRSDGGYRRSRDRPHQPSDFPTERIEDADGASGADIRPPAIPSSVSSRPPWSLVIGSTVTRTCTGQGLPAVGKMRRDSSE